MQDNTNFKCSKGLVIRYMSCCHLGTDFQYLLTVGIAVYLFDWNFLGKIYN